MGHEHDNPVRSRRRFVGEAAVLGVGGSLGGWIPAAVRAQDQTEPSATPPPDGEPIGLVRAPTWTFVVYRYEDPYAGSVQGTSTVPPNARIIGLEIEITNDSPNPLPFYTSSVHLRTADGFDYFNFQLYGVEPRLIGRTLGRGDTARGWLWFGVPRDTVLDRIVFIAPAPELGIAVPG